jgi:signal transduction histidine kinase
MAGMAELMQSAIENVVRNAIRYAPPGTCVDITLERQGEAPARAVLRVRDHGPGVPNDRLLDIFLPFTRAGDSPGSGGAGLGLAITQRVVQLHEGTVRAVNAPDGGLLVELQLPLLDDEGTAQTGQGR